MMKWRNIGGVKIASAIALLVLYISTMVAGDVMSLMCGCCHHDHSADVHTAFRHIHKCDAEECHHDHALEYAVPEMKGRCSCNHDHSTEIKLYTPPQTLENSLRQTILLAVLMDNSVTIESPEGALSFVYQEHILPSLTAGYGGGQSLRAPPAIV